MNVKRGDIVLSKSGYPFVVASVQDPLEGAEFCTLYSPRTGVTLAGKYTKVAFEDGRLRLTPDTYDLDGVEEQRLAVQRAEREEAVRQKADAATIQLRVKRTQEGEGEGHD
jgi:hypothetical protein